jgi:hypothetical protein
VEERLALTVVYPDFLNRGGAPAHALAAWLQHNTTLTAAQICDWTGLGRAALTKVEADGSARSRLSPVNQRLLTRTEIRRCEGSAQARLEKRVAIFAAPDLTAGPPAAVFNSTAFHAARLATVHFLTDGRNAWHSTWVNRYFPGAITGRDATARQQAERQRLQGSVFVITPTPALVLQSDKLTLVGVEVNPRGEFERLSEVFDGPFTAGRVLDAYGSARQDSVLWLHAAGNHRFDDWNGASLFQWRSRSHGGNYRLGWYAHAVAAQPSSGFRKIVQRAGRTIRRMRDH